MLFNIVYKVVHQGRMWRTTATVVGNSIKTMFASVLPICHIILFPFDFCDPHIRDSEVCSSWFGQRIQFLVFCKLESVIMLWLNLSNFFSHAAYADISGPQ